MSDIPRDEAIRQANDLVAKGWTVFFKFTCEKCGARCSFEEPNTLYEYGECCVCGHNTKADLVGFSVVGMLGKPPGNN